MSAPSSRAASVGTGTRAIPSTSRRPSLSKGGNNPATDVAARSADQRGPSSIAVASRATRSAVIATSGGRRSAKDFSWVSSWSSSVITLSPLDVPANESLKISATFSSVKLRRIVSSISVRVLAEPDQRAHDRADAAARHAVDGVAGPFEHAQDADVRVALRAAGAEREAELGAGEMAAEPGDVVGGRRLDGAVDGVLHVAQPLLTRARR